MHFGSSFSRKVGFYNKIGRSVHFRVHTGSRCIRHDFMYIACHNVDLLQVFIFIGSIKFISSSYLLIFNATDINISYVFLQ